MTNKHYKKILTLLILCSFPILSYAQIKAPNIVIVSKSEVKQACANQDCCGCYYKNTKTIIISDSNLCGITPKGVLIHEYIHYLVDVSKISISAEDDQQLATEIGMIFSYPTPNLSLLSQTSKDNLQKLLTNL